jgi:hypothetical protein
LGFIADALRDQLENEPVVLEQGAATEALIAKTRRCGREMLSLNSQHHVRPLRPR